MIHSVKPPNAFGELLRRNRKQRKLKIATVAQAIGFSQGFVSGLETGHNQPKLPVVQAICDTLSLPLDDRFEMLRAAGFASSDTGTEVSAVVRRLTQVLSASDLADAQKQDLAMGLDAFLGRWIRHQRPGKTNVTLGVVPAAGWQNQLLPHEWFERTLMHAVAESIEAGIEELIIIVAPENAQLQRLNEIFDSRIDLRFEIQRDRAGLGHALLQSLPHVGERPFAVLLPDEVDETSRNATKELIEAYEEIHRPLIAVNSRGVTASGRLARYYGLAILGRKIQGHGQVFRVQELKEKPGSGFEGDARCIAGRYLLTPEIFRCIQPRGPAQRYELTDALRKLLEGPQSPYAYKLDRTLTALAPLRAMIEDMESNPVFDAARYAEERVAEA